MKAPNDKSFIERGYASNLINYSLISIAFNLHNRLKATEYNVLTLTRTLSEMLIKLHFMKQISLSHIFLYLFFCLLFNLHVVKIYFKCLFFVHTVERYM